jgi:lysophospholipase L1-like esterase
VRILCLGDSNTEQAVAPDRQSWCERVASRHPQWQFVNGGLHFTPASGDCFLCGRTLLGTTLAMSSYDLVLIALGTNDLVNFGYSPEATVDALLALRAQALASNADAMIATVPPVFGARRGSGPQIDAANALLARRVPSDHLLQLHVELEAADFRDDGVHLNGSGHEKYAIAADRGLSGRWTLRAALPAGCTRTVGDSPS